MDSPQASVLVVEKHPLMREAICAAIQDNPILSVVAQTSTGNDALTHLHHYPDVILYSQELLNPNDIYQLRQLLPEIPIVILTQSESLDVEQFALISGFITILPRSTTCSEIIDALIQHSGISFNQINNDNGVTPKNRFGEHT